MQFKTCDEDAYGCWHLHLLVLPHFCRKAARCNIQKELTMPVVLRPRGYMLLYVKLISNGQNFSIEVIAKIVFERNALKKLQFWLQPH
jgi:hypothetical protein